MTKPVSTAQAIAAQSRQGGASAGNATQASNAAAASVSHPTKLRSIKTQRFLPEGRYG